MIRLATIMMKCNYPNIYCIFCLFNCE